MGNTLLIKQSCPRRQFHLQLAAQVPRCCRMPARLVGIKLLPAVDMILIALGIRSTPAICMRTRCLLQNPKCVKLYRMIDYSN